MVFGTAAHQQWMFQQATRKHYANHARQAGQAAPAQAAGFSWPPPPPLPPAPLPPPPPLLEVDAAALVTHVLSAPMSHPHGAFYCLGLLPSATADAVRKQYKQLALRLHPDKCSHERAREAFDAVHGAYTKLAPQ